MTYPEAKKYKPGDKIGFYGRRYNKIPELKNGPETLDILAVNIDTAMRVVSFEVDSPTLGRVTRPHPEFQRAGVEIPGLTLGEPER